MKARVRRRRGRCTWCGVQMSGLRRWWAFACRRCTPRLRRAASRYLPAGYPGVPLGARTGQVEPLPLLRILRWGGHR